MKKADKPIIINIQGNNKVYLGKNLFCLSAIMNITLLFIMIIVLAIFFCYPESFKVIVRWINNCILNS